tara:strand:- start:492 stop:1145 length:654 start_codon:yes stop_codon:yes gene_type:complete
MKNMNKLYFMFIFLLAAHQSIIHAAPMNFKGSTTSMTQVSKDYISIESSYALSIKESFGAKTIKAKGNGYETTSGEIFYLRKLMRKNTIKSQLNLWLFTRAGFIDIKKNKIKEHHVYLSPTLQFDYETKRVYGMFSHQVLRAGHENFDTTKIEGGFSFYEAGYTEIQPWFILKTKNINSLNNEIKYTPSLRFINKSIFMDAGISTDGDASFHFMYTF